jgi:Zn-dependent protease
MYLGLLALLTFHEFGHAWMAWRCGDDTAKLQGRCSLNPLVHIDPIGTVLLPLVMIFLPGAGQFLVGWAKPVPVNAHNLRNPRWDDILVSLAGPWMNLLLAVGLVGLARLSLTAGSPSLPEFCLRTAQLSLVLCFFNLIPIPPLDGSHVLRSVTAMSHETYAKFARFGFIAVIIVIQVPLVQHLLGGITRTSLSIIAGWFGLA